MWLRVHPSYNCLSVNCWPVVSISFENLHRSLFFCTVDRSPSNARLSFIFIQSSLLSHQFTHRRPPVPRLLHACSADTTPESIPVIVSLLLFVPSHVPYHTEKVPWLRGKRLLGKSYRVSTETVVVLQTDRGESHFDDSPYRWVVP